MKKKRNSTFVNNLITYLIVIVAFVAVTLLQNAGMISRSLKGQLVPICVYIVMAVSLNLVVGISGELSLGHAGFMSVGAFAGAIFCMATQDGIADPTVRLILGMLVGGVFAGIMGVIVGVPVLRLQGDYLAIVTLAFGEIIRNVLNCVYVSNDAGQLYFGFNNPSLPGMQAYLPAMMALRDNRIAAESVGISVTKYKLMAFVTSAVLAGMAGTLFGMNFSTFTASKFKFDTSILVLVFVVLGGIGNIRGSVIAAALLTILPELLRSFNDYRMLVYAIVLIVVMLVTNGERSKQWLAMVKARLSREEKGEAEQ